MVSTLLEAAFEVELHPAREFGTKVPNYRSTPSPEGPTNLHKLCWVKQLQNH